MKILVTNNAIASRSGSELYVQEIAQALSARGHQVAVFSTQVGDLGEKMKAQGIFVTEDLEKMPWIPDVIHGQHHLETMIALTYFADTPSVYFCHGWKPWEEAPPIHPRIRQYKAVDVKTLQEAVERHGVPAENIEIVHNFVDLKKFKPREKLPKKPQKALVFSNYADEHNFLPHIQKACEKAGIALDVVGASSGNPTEKPEEILGNYELVFAVGRSALEALASGVSVVICGVWGVGPLVTFKEVEGLRDRNFGVAAMHSPLDEDIIYREICRYDGLDAMRVTQYLRDRIGLDEYVENIEKLYEHIIEKFDPKEMNPENEHRFQAKYLQNVAVFLKQNICNATLIEERDVIIREKNVELLQKEHEIAVMTKSKFWKIRNSYLAIKNIFKKTYE